MSQQPLFENVGESHWEEVVRLFGEEFWFDPTELTFHVTPFRSVSLNEAADDARANFGMVDLYVRDEGILSRYADGPNSALLALMSNGELRPLPSLREWIAGLYQDAEKIGRIQVDTITVMQNVFELLSPEINKYEPNLKAELFRNTFWVKFRETGDFILQTYGVCACIAPVRDLSEDEPPLYKTHNIESVAQALSLHAGAGYLAYIARQEQAAGLA